MAGRALVIVVVICLIAGVLWAQVGPTGKTTRARPDLRGTNMVILEVVPSTTLVNAGTPLTADIVVRGIRKS